MTVRTNRPPPPGARPGPVDPARAWAPYRPDEERPWTLALAGHLFRRAAFGASWEQLQRALTIGPERAVDELVRPPGDVEASGREFDGYDEAIDSVEALRAWWLRRMIDTPHPLRERMTLFWHDHFAIGATGQQSGTTMRRHLRLLRRHALGPFRPFLEDVSRDPAVLLWLGAEENRKAQPRDGFSRALFEEYTVGPGGFRESDVREAARAFTGAFVKNGRYRFVPREHDEGGKRIFDREGAFDGDDVVRLALEHPATPQNLVRALYRALISETDEPDESLIAPLARSFAEDFDVAKLVETMLRSNLFFSPTAYRRRIKSPVEFAVGVVRTLEGTVSTTRLAGDLERLGQSLLQPPTVKGWAGGRAWINRVTLVRRQDLARALLHGGKPYGNELDPGRVAAKHGHSGPQASIRFLLELFLQGDLEPAVADALGTAATAAELRRFAHDVVVLPEFQMA